MQEILPAFDHKCVSRAMTGNMNVCWRISSSGLVVIFLILFCASSFAQTPVKQWTRIWGSSDWEYSGRGTSVDASGNVYIVGQTYGSFDGQTNAGGGDLCLTKHDPAGNRIWTRIWGSSLNDIGFGVSVDASSNVYVAGYTQGSFDGQTNAGNADLCLSKYTPDGNKIWTRIWGGSSFDFAGAVSVDASNNVYVAGQAYSSFDGQTNAGSGDLCLTKYDPDGNKIWTRIWGSSSEDSGFVESVDASGNVYVAGRTFGSFDGQTNAGGGDLCLTKHDPAGNRIWTRIWGSSSNDIGFGVSVDASSNVYVAGYTDGSFDGQTNAGNTDSCLTKYDPAGNRIWTRIWGSSSNDYGFGASVDTSGNVYIVGQTFGSFDGQTNAGGGDLCLTKHDPAGNRLWTRIWGGSSDDFAPVASVDASNNVYVAGDTQGSFDGQTNAGNTDLCLTKWLDPPTPIHYVSTNGLDLWPYTNWATAANSIQDAIDTAYSGDTVLVTNGTYILSSQIEITNGITVQSVNGALNTIVDGNNSNRCFYLNHSNSVVDGFTITRGYEGTGGDGTGGGARVVNGTLDNCIITGNWAFNYGGGTAYGTINNCIISSNYSGAFGGGSYYSTLNNCVIANNSVANDGGGSYYGTLNNCIIKANTAIFGGGTSEAALNNCIITGNSADRGGGVRVSLWSAPINNCTIVGNSASIAGGGVWDFPNVAILNNCIVYANTAPSSSNYNAGVTMTYCCTSPDPGSIGNITNDPQLTPTYRLKSTSPCIDAGTWSNATSTDIDGEARWDHPGHTNIASIVDIGADEFVDVDLDNMADYWETETFGNTNMDGTADGDGDGLNNLTEYDGGTAPYNPDTDGDGMNDGDEVNIAGTSPTEASSVFQITDFSRITTNDLITWSTVTGKNYTVQTTTNLMSSWTNVPDPMYTNIMGSGAPLSYTNTDSVDPHRFFRVKVR